MKRIITILMLFPFLSIGQTISPYQLGINSLSQFGSGGKNIGAFMYIAPNDTAATIGYHTNSGYTYQLSAPFITNDYSGTAVSREYVDSAVLRIPSLHIGARIPGARPNSVLFINHAGGLFSDPNFQYQYDPLGNSVLKLRSGLGYMATGGYQAVDTNGNLVMFSGELNTGNAYNYVGDASGVNYVETFVADDGSDAQLQMGTTAGTFKIVVDPSSGGALFSSSVSSYGDFEVLDGSANITADVNDGYITSMSADEQFGVFMQTSSDGSTNNFGVYNPIKTLLLRQSFNSQTWNISLPIYRADPEALVGGLTTGDLYQDLSNIVHIKR